VNGVINMANMENLKVKDFLGANGEVLNVQNISRIGNLSIEKASRLQQALKKSLRIWKKK
jgi:hypothetical protein